MTRTTPDDRSDPADILARYHARHGVRHLACPVCMRPRATRVSRTVRRPRS